MNAVSSLLAMVSAVSLTLGVIHLRFWLLERFRRDRLAFALLCCSAFVYSWLEIILLHTETTETYSYIVRASQLPSFIALVLAAVFLRANLGAGRNWLMWMFVALKGLAVLLSLLAQQNPNFHHISEIGHIDFLGETLAYPIGDWSPLRLVSQAASVVLLVFSIDATIAAWRKGRQKQAAIMGGGVTLFIATSLAMSVIVPSGSFRLPWVVSPALLFVTAAMGYQLNRDMHRSAALAKELIERKIELSETTEQLALSVEAANVGIWTRNLGNQTISATAKCRELFGFAETGQITFEAYLQRVHPGDRRRLLNALTAAESNGSEYSVEYRLLFDDMKIRWIESRGKAEFENGKPKLFRGASVDITQRKLAETPAHELSRKLIWAQEKERTRLARELHDDLSQRLALLSIQLAELKKDYVDARYLRQQVDSITSEIQSISSDVHRMSHELHPAKLDQLGLESALRGFCRELEATHPVSISVEVVNLPNALSKDVSLCLYRVSQEALQNAIKHSGASRVKLVVKGGEGEIQLDVLDNGSGFDPKMVRLKESLGLISIDERIHAANGVVKIDSSVGAGTHIEAHVPIANDAEGPELRFVASS
jgi:signal transduction histidine kinase